VTLEILDVQVHTVRRYASTDAPLDLAAVGKEEPIPTYWVQQPQILSAAAGMHRFVWDLHYTAPDSLGHGYPISAILHDTPPEPKGARALPGQYSVKLTAGGKSETQPLTLKMDPRVKVAPENLAQQFAVESDAVQGMNESAAALKQVRALRAQLKDRAEKAGKGPIADAIGALDKKLGDLEGGRQQGFFGPPPTAGEKENFSTLNQHFGGLLRTADSADAAPTTQAMTLHRELDSAQQSLRAEWKQIESRDVTSLNDSLQKAGLAPVSAVAGSGPGK
jgi:hypothetical protein